MPSRGFVAIWYSGYGLNRPNPNAGTREFWKTMVAGVLRAWRAHHPDDRLTFLDLDSQFNRIEWDHLSDMGIHDGRLVYCLPGRLSRPWTRTYLDKALALEFSPYDETCLFDLDILFLSNISRVFDLVEQVGVLGYPFYKRTRNRICNGLWVVKDKSIWPAFWRAVDDVRVPHPFDDEAALDLCIDRGQVRVTKLSPTYGMDPFCWLMRDGSRRRPGNRGWCDVRELQPPASGNFPASERMLGHWRMGDSVVRAIHMSGARDRIVGSELWNKYMHALSMELIDRYGDRFPLCCE